MAVEYKKEESWVPRTELGKKVMNREITSIDEILDAGKKIFEPEIVDILLPGMHEEVMEIESTQRMTASGRKQQMKAVVILGNRNGYIAVGVGKATETSDAIAEAVRDSKKHLIRVPLGCGSWECGCGTNHSISQQVRGHNSSTEIIIKPAPRGVGLVAGEVSRKVLELAGVKDAWSFSRGRTRNVMNMVLATFDALDSLNKLKYGKDYVEEKPAETAVEEVKEEIVEAVKEEKTPDVIETTEEKTE